MHSSQSELRKKWSKRVNAGSSRSLGSTSTPSPTNLVHLRNSENDIPPKLLQDKPKLQKRRAQIPRNISPRRPNDNLPKFLIWVKNEPFDFGIISPLPCPKIGINILRKIAGYCKEKPGHYPEFSLNQWNHICKYKIQLINSDLCTAYFRVFDIISRSTSTWTRHEGTKLKMTSTFNNDKNSPSTSSTKNDKSGQTETQSRDVKFYKMLNQGYDATDEFKADTLQFLLFLYIQHFHRLHKKFSMRSHAGGDDPWPKHSGRPHSAGGSPLISPEQQHAEFLSINLEDMIDFLMILHNKRNPLQTNYYERNSPRKENDSNSSLNDSNEEARVAVPVIRALSLILGSASISYDREFQFLDECLNLPEVAAKLDFDMENMTVNRRSFKNWIVGHLKVNPWGPSSVPIPQVPISLMTGVCSTEDFNDDNNDKDTDTRVLEAFKKNRIFWNTQCYPKAWVLISGVDKQTLLMDSLKPLSSIKIHRCTDSNIYLPGAHKMILVQKCRDLNLNLGVATKVVKIVDCSNLTLTGVGRLFIICDSSASIFHLLTPSSPIICGNKNHKIQLAPYNSSYPGLENDMKIAGISPKVQKWNKPLELSTDGFPHDHLGHDSNVSIMRPNQFRMSPFPFKLNRESDDGATEEKESSTFTSSLPPLPSPYQQRLTSISENMEKVKKEFQSKLLSNSKLTSNENINLLYRITLDRFKKWLKETGNYEQIVGLVSLQKSLQQEEDLSSPVILSSKQDLACIAKALKKLFCLSYSRATGNRSPSPLYGRSLMQKSDRDREKRRSSLTGRNSSRNKPSQDEFNRGDGGGAGESDNLRKSTRIISARFGSKTFLAAEMHLNG